MDQRVLPADVHNGLPADVHNGLPADVHNGLPADVHNGLPADAERGRSASGNGRTLQRVLVDRATELRPLYWRASRHEREGSGPYSAILQADGGITLLAGTTVSFDTYFGGFFETHWRLNTRLQTLRLTVSVSGSCIVRLRRRSIGVDRLLAEQEAAPGDRQTLVFEIKDGSINFREYGMLYFEVTALGEAARFLEAAWTAAGPSRPVCLGIVFCTFNRERWLGPVLQALADDPLVLAQAARIFVVNQGTPGLAAHPLLGPAAEQLGSRLTIIEQDNFGGAGGFTRGLLATLDDPSLTHCAFLDDDIRIEPDTILRLSAFLSLAHDDVAFGGHMLDQVQPTRLYEAGAIMSQFDWFPRPVLRDVDLTRIEGLDSLVQPSAVHFNGWWCFAVSLEIVRRVGLPMPCFIRGDDAEYGMRLYRAGIHTVSLPGAAVWHEPFYLKLGGWQLYYETRNLLMLAALHKEFSPAAAFRRAGRSWVLHLLTFRYYGAMLILRGIADFLDGPEVLHRDPRPLHAAVTALRARYGPRQIDRNQVLVPQVVASMPRRRASFVAWFVFVLLRHSSRRVPDTAPRLIGAGDFSWIGLRHADHIVLDNWWEPLMSVYRRDRRLFREIVRRGVPLLLRLMRRGTVSAALWRAAAPELTSVEFWRRYLGPA